MQFHSSSSNGTHIVEVEGEVDIYSAPRLNEALLAIIRNGDVNLAVDLEKVRFIDSAGLSVFLNAKNALQENNGRLVLVTANRRFHRILTLAGMADAFRICDDRDQACSVLEAASRPDETTLSK